MILAYGTFKIRARGACNAVTSRRRRREEERTGEGGEDKRGEEKRMENVPRIAGGEMMLPLHGVERACTCLRARARARIAKSRRIAALRVPMR